MNRAASRLVVRLAVLQIVVRAITYTLFALFAPRMLLLEPSAASGARVLALGFFVLSAAFSVAATLVLTRPLGPALRALAAGNPNIRELDVRRLDVVPARLSLANVSFVFLLSVATLSPKLRPPQLDPYSDLALVLLILTWVSTAALPAYVTLRASVAKVLELVSPDATRAALRHLGRRNLGSVRKRFVFAVAAPVAFVALGASLLVDAHARAYDRDTRVEDASDMARAVFEPLGDEARRVGRGGGVRATPQDRGVAEIVKAAAEFGFAVTFDPSYSGPSIVRHGDEGETDLVVSVSPGAAMIRFDASRLSPTVAIYVALALAAIALAAILGSRIAVTFEADVALARRAVQRAGVADVMRGTIILHEARFSNVRALLGAIDALGGVFREFAGAQERAIEARGSTEQMRGLLLASMSHDLKAPLNAVLGFAELVRRSSLTEGQRESLAIIEQRGRELLMLIDTILDSARAEAGELEIVSVQTDVSDVVMSAVLDARDLVVGTDVQIKGQIQPGIPTLFVDSTRIVQALTAVVMTAVRFSKKSIVEVRATLPDEGDRLRIEVETSGEGLPHDEREKMFDAFKSAKSARRHGALGLGLQLARSIVEIHGGTFEIDNAEGGGVILRAWLPLETDPDAIRARASNPPR
ncbi:MAG: HAMP domain-containing histidine kinase [Polyangiaceae bacterium]|nr:HAMP domain-containing histidine kinase [Polyangiaceae bacterium]